MNRSRLANLLASNAAKGSFRAEGNTIFIYDMIVGSDLEAEWFGGVSPGRFQAQLAAMTGPVALRINSPGGDVFGARAIVQAMREYPGEITAHVDGYAASAASLIAVGAGRLVMAEGSFLMIHKAWTLAMGNADEMLATAELLEKVDGTLADTYAAKGKGDAAHYAALMTAETWFTPAEALAEGLADDVVQAPAKAAATSSTTWNLSAYQRPPAPVAIADTPVPSDDGAAEKDTATRIRRHAAAMALRAA
jgi:ATP-dependent protease ClpP protease subunit